MTSFMDIAFNLVIAIGSLIGLIGSVRVYIEWQSADQNTRKAIMPRVPDIEEVDLKTYSGLTLE